MSAPTTLSLSQRFRRLVATEWGTILFTAVSVAFFVGAFGLRGQAGYFPMGVSSFTVAFGLAVLALGLREGARASSPADEPEALEWNRRTVLAIAWFAFALAATYVLGIVIGAAIASTVYFLLLTSVRPIYALVNGAAFSLFIWVVFKQLAGLPVYGGMF